MDASRYQGKNLAVLIASICLPALMLYIRLVLGVVQNQSSVSASASRALTAASTVMLIVFAATQAGCAYYLQRALKPARTRLARIAQYFGTLALGILLSVTGAVTLEAFGINVLLRAGALR